MRRLIIIVFLSGSLKPSAQHFYIHLQELFNRVDRDLMADSEHIQTITLMRLDSVPQDAFIFAKHALKGLKICAYAHDSARISIWCRIALRHGFNLYQLARIPILKDIDIYISSKEAEALHQQYLSRLKPEIAREMKNRFIYDQKLTHYINDGKPGLKKVYISITWYFNNIRNYKYIKKCLRSIGYPGEYICGISQDTVWAGVAGDFKGYYMLLHYYSYSKRNLLPELIQASQNGQILPANVAVIGDYFYKFGHRGKPYGTWFDIKNKWMEQAADAQRHQIGLFPISEQIQKDSLYQNKNLSLIRAIGFE